MPQTVNVDGELHYFPDDAKPEEIQAALADLPRQEKRASLVAEQTKLREADPGGWARATAAGQGNAFLQLGTAGIGAAEKAAAGVLSGLPMPVDPDAMNEATAREIIRRQERTPSQTYQEIQRNPLFEHGQALQDVAPEVHPIPEGEKGIWPTAVSGAAGGFVPLMASGPLAPLTIGLQSAGEHITADYEAAKNANKSDDEAATIAMNNSLKSGGIQAAIFAFLPKPLRDLGDKWLINKFGAQPLARFFAARAAQAGEGAVLGSASTLGEGAATGEMPTLGQIGHSAAAMAAMQVGMPKGRTESETAFLGPEKNFFERHREAQMETDIAREEARISGLPTQSDLGAEAVPVRSPSTVFPTMATGPAAPTPTQEEFRTGVRKANAPLPAPTVVPANEYVPPDTQPLHVDDPLFNEIPPNGTVPIRNSKLKGRLNEIQPRPQDQPSPNDQTGGTLGPEDQGRPGQAASPQETPPETAPIETVPAPPDKQAVIQGVAKSRLSEMGNPVSLDEAIAREEKSVRGTLKLLSGPGQPAINADQYGRLTWVLHELRRMKGEQNAGASQSSVPSGTVRGGGNRESGQTLLEQKSSQVPSPNHTGKTPGEYDRPISPGTTQTDVGRKDQRTLSEQTAERKAALGLGRGQPAASAETGKENVALPKPAEARPIKPSGPEGRNLENATIPKRSTETLPVDETSTDSARVGARPVVSDGQKGIPPEKPGAPVPQEKAPAEPAPPLTLPPLEKLSEFSPDNFVTWQKELGSDKVLQAQKQYAAETSPVTVRQHAQRAADEATEARNVAAGNNESKAINAYADAANKVQFFNEVLREQGEAPVSLSFQTGGKIKQAAAELTGKPKRGKLRTGAPETITGPGEEKASSMPAETGEKSSEALSPVQRAANKTYNTLKKQVAQAQEDFDNMADALRKLQKSKTEASPELQDLYKQRLEILNDLKGKLSVAESNPDRPKNIKRGISGSARFNRETQMLGEDILSWITDQMPIMSRNGAKKYRGEEWYKENKSDWDDAPTELSSVHHNVIYRDAKNSPNQVAEAAFREKLIKEPSTSALWDAIKKASADRAAGMKGEGREQKILAQDEKELVDWEAATKQGKVQVSNEDLAPGDVLEVEGERVEVVSRDPETGDVTLKDGRKFGTQTLPEGRTIYVEKFEEAVSGSTDFLNPEQAAPETPTPATPRLEEKAKSTERDLTKREQDEFADLTLKIRSNRESGGPPLTTEETQRYEKLTALAGQGDLLAAPEADQAAVLGRIKTLRDKAEQMEKLRVSTQNRAFDSKFRRDELGKEADTYWAEANKARAEADRLERTLNPPSDVKEKAAAAGFFDDPPEDKTSDGTGDLFSIESSVPQKKPEPAKRSIEDTVSLEFANATREQVDIGIRAVREAEFSKFTSRAEAVQKKYMMLAVKEKMPEFGDFADIKKAKRLLELVENEKTTPPKAAEPAKENPPAQPEGSGVQPAAGKQGSEPGSAEVLRYRVKGQGPQTWTVEERLPQTALEKEAGDPIAVRIKNEKTGKIEEIYENQLEAVRTRTAEEREAAKGMSKREIDDALLKAGMEPSLFPDRASKLAALKRWKALKGDKNKQISVTSEPGPRGLGVRLEDPADIRDALKYLPSKVIPAPVRFAMSKLLETGLLDKIPNVKWDIVDAIEDGARGEYLPDRKVIRFMRFAEADVPIHEFFHHLHRYLKDEDAQVIRELRVETIKAELAVMDGISETSKIALKPRREQLERLLKEPMASDEFRNAKFDFSTYHYSNEFEFFTWLMTDRAMKEFNQPRARGFVEHVRRIIQQIHDALKDAFGFSKYEDVLWREIRSGSYEFTQNNSLAFRDSLESRNLALARTRREVSEQMLNYDDLSPLHQQALGSELEMQNKFAERIYNRALATAPAGVRAKTRFIVDRMEAIGEARARGTLDVQTYEEVMAHPSIEENTKQIIVGSMTKNVLDFREKAENTIMQADQKISQYQDKMREIAVDLDVQKLRREFLENASRRIVSDYQNRFLTRAQQAQSAGEAYTIADTMRRLQQMRSQTTSIGFIIDQMAATVPEDVLMRPDITTPELMRAFLDANGGSIESAATAMGEAGRGISTDFLRLATEIMQASDELANRVLVIRSTINPEEAAQIEQLATELRNAARRGNRTDLRNFAREIGGTAEGMTVARRAIGRLQPKLRRASRQLSEWNQASDILTEALGDPELRAFEAKVYGHFNVRKTLMRKGGDHELIFTNPLTREEIRLFPDLSKMGSEENYAKMQKLLSDAQSYLQDTESINYDPRVAEAWKFVVENLQGFWLNPSMNVFVPHATPFHFDLFSFLSDPAKTLRATAGLESNEAQVKGTAMAKAKRQLMEWERKSGNTVEAANREAAKKAGLTLNEWYDRVYNEVAFRMQHFGQVPPRVGETLLSGHKVTAADLQAARSQFSYLRHVRDIAENAGGFTASQLSPARVIENGISRLAIPTGLVTLPVKRSGRGAIWARKWREFQSGGTEADIAARRYNWLNQPDIFDRVVMGHLKTYQTPDYKIPTRWRTEYKGIVEDYQLGEGPETISDIVDTLFERQPFTEEGEPLFTRQQISDQIYGEISKGFDNFESEGVSIERDKPDPIIDTLSAENTFTRPRSEKIASPFTFYDYGVKDMPARLRAGNDAYSWYSLEFVNSLRRLDSALGKRIADIEEGIKSGTTTAKAVSAGVRRGDEWYDLAQLKLNKNRIGMLLKQQTRVLKSAKDGRSSVDGLIYRVQSAIGAHILMTPGARSTHTFGMMGVSGVFNALTENAIIRPQAVAWARFAGAILKDIASVPALPFKSEKLRAFGDSMPAGKAYADMVIRRREQMERLKELGIIPEADVAGAWQAMLRDWGNVFRRGAPEPTGERWKKAIAATSDLHNTLSMSVSPQRYNDWLLNSHIREMRQDLVRGLMETSEKYVRQRRDVLGSGYTDFSKPENVLTAQEITGRRGAMGEREAFEKRKLFKVLGLDLDTLMLDYSKRIETARMAGEELGSVSFLKPEQENSLDFQIALDTGLASPITRNLASQGSLPRRLMGYIHGLPLSTMGKFLGLFNRLSTQSGPQYLAATAPLVLMAGAYTTLMGLARIQSTSTLNRAIFNQASAIPTISQAKSAEDWLRLLIRSQAGWWPIIGDVINAAVLRTPDRMGHLDSMFVMWNFLTDIVNMGGDMLHTKDILGSLESFGRRWFPWTKIISSRMESQTGVRDHYNAVADIQSAIPPDMEITAAKFRGGLKPTETTPLTMRALNAMYNGDWAALEQVRQEFIAKKTQAGVQNPASSFTHSISAHNPWIERLGKLPTEQERQEILSRMDDTQREEVQKAENVFRSFGDRYNARVAFTQEQSEAPRSNSSGGSAGGTGSAPTASVPSGGGSGGSSRSGSGGGAGLGRRISLNPGANLGSRIGRISAGSSGHLRLAGAGSAAGAKKLVTGKLRSRSGRATSPRPTRLRLHRTA